MKPLGIRFCQVAPAQDSAGLAEMLRRLGMEENDMGGGEAFAGAVFPSQGNSWVEMWPEAEGIPNGFMLQIVVEDADAVAEEARANGLNPVGPVDAHGERIYYLTAPGGLPVSFQSVVTPA